MSLTIEQLTAYALGEGTPAERSAIADELARDPVAREEVAAIQQAAELLSGSLGAEASPGLDPARRAALASLSTAAVSTAAPAPRRLRFPHWVVWPGVLAASLAVVSMRLQHAPHENSQSPVLALRTAEQARTSDKASTSTYATNGLAADVTGRISVANGVETTSIADGLVIAAREPQQASQSIGGFAGARDATTPFASSTAPLAAPAPVSQVEYLDRKENGKRRATLPATPAPAAAAAAPMSTVTESQPVLAMKTKDEQKAGGAKRARDERLKDAAASKKRGDTRTAGEPVMQDQETLETDRLAAANADTATGKIGAVDDTVTARAGQPQKALTKQSTATLDQGQELAKQGADEAPTQPEVATGEAYPAFAADGWHRVTTAADDTNRLSTLGADVDSASYANVRRFLSNGQLPPADAVRTEELLNSFTYSYLPPVDQRVPFAVHPEVGAAPWAPEHRLVRIALKGYELDRAHRPPANLVFLVDVSGSMNEPTKLPLVQRALSLLTEQLRSDDHVAIVTYAGAAGVLLPATTGEDKPRILAAIAGLSAGGSTNGAGGIRSAYDVAKQSFIRGGANRVVLCTDGDFNVGVSSREDLERLISDEARSNVFLTALGFGMGNYHDTTMQVLADRGNGQYAYIDTEAEAQKQLVDGCTGMLVTIAKDVKLQVEFNPAQVGAWRLLGYEKRHLEHEDFLDDSKDGGEIGAGHSMTALYEIVPTARTLANVPPLRYASDDAPIVAAKATGDELLTINLRWKLPEGVTSTGIALPVATRGNGEPSADFTFAAAVAEFAQVLRGASGGNWSLDRALRAAQASAGNDVQRREFIDLVRKAQQLSR